MAVVFESATTKDTMELEGLKVCVSLTRKGDVVGLNWW